MTWDDIDITVFIKGCLTSGFIDENTSINGDQQSITKLLNIFVEALNEKNYAVNYQAEGNLLDLEFNYGDIQAQYNQHFRKNLTTDLDILINAYRSMWMFGWYSEEALTDVANFDDYKLSNQDLIDATSQGFWDILIAPYSYPLFEKWSETVIQGLYTLFKMMRYCKIRNRFDGETGSFSLDGSYKYGSGRINSRIDVNNPGSCALYNTSTVETNSYNSLLANINQRNLIGFYDIDWQGYMWINNFYNFSREESIYYDYNDGNFINVKIRKISTGDLLDNLSLAYKVKVSKNRKYSSTTYPGGNMAVINELGLYDNNFPAGGGHFDFLSSSFNKGVSFNNDDGYGIDLNYENHAPPKLVVENPVAQVCKNTPGIPTGYHERNKFNVVGATPYMLFDSNHPDLDYYIDSPAP